MGHGSGSCNEGVPQKKKKLKLTCKFKEQKLPLVLRLRLSLRWGGEINNGTHIQESQANRQKD